MKAESSVSVNAIPANPDNLPSINASNAYSQGDLVVNKATGLVYYASDAMRGTFDPDKVYNQNDVVQTGNTAYTLTAKHNGTWNAGLTNAIVGASGTVSYNGMLWELQGGGDASIALDSANPTNWVALEWWRSSATAATFGTRTNQCNYIY